MESSIFFGLFTIGIFLILYSRRTEEKHTPTPISTPVVSSTSITCPNCGAALDVGATFCAQCGGRARKE
ncbi:MAG: zinc ribbon domain-containing protein [Candidatus Bathyarchaeota archaeon]